MARPVEAFAATYWNSTSPAPNAASASKNANEAQASFRTRWPRGNNLRLQPSSPATASNAPPLMTRCVNSITVEAPASLGITSPLQSGQWLPQPAPEPLARTNTPHSPPRTLQPSTPQA